MNSYNDFLGELIQEETRTGKRRRPDKENPITKGREQLRKQIVSQAQELGKDPADVALEYVAENSGTLQRYVTTRGEQPFSNPSELALQAFLLRQNEINDVAKTLGTSFAEAEIYLDENESKAVEINSSDADNFLGAIAEAIGSVAAKGVKKIQDKRTAAGKKPSKFWNTLADITGANKPQMALVEGENETGGKGLDGLKIFAKDVLDGIKQTEKKKEINKMLPYIIIGVIVLILTVVLITRNAKN